MRGQLGMHLRGGCGMGPTHDWPVVGGCSVRWTEKGFCYGCGALTGAGVCTERAVMRSRLALPVDES
jgi:hypothetical protein